MQRQASPTSTTAIGLQLPSSAATSEGSEEDGAADDDVDAERGEVPAAEGALQSPLTSLRE